MEQFFFVIHTVFVKQFNRIGCAERSFLDWNLAFYHFLHIFFYLIKKFLIYRHISVNGKIISRTDGKMNHDFSDSFRSCHMIHSFQQKQTHTSFIAFVSDSVSSCNKFNGAVFFWFFMQFPQFSFFQNQDNGIAGGSFVFFCNLCKLLD